MSENQKKVLIFEPNPFHYEVVPGFANYFLRLGYQVDCLLRKDIRTYGDVFCRCPALKEKIRFFQYEKNKAAETIGALQREHGYDLLFFNSINVPQDKPIWKMLAQVKPLFDGKQGIAGCCHTLEKKEYANLMRYFKNRIVTLSATAIPNIETAEVNPHYFCEKTPQRALHDRVSLISVGMSVNVNELQTAANGAYRKTGKLCRLSIVRRPETNWEIFLHDIKYAIIKIFHLKLSLAPHECPKQLDEQVKKEITFTGCISFQDLFSRIEQSDFIVLNIYDYLKQDFISVQTSGAKQLSLAFLIPCIIEKKTAGYYGFTEKNAIVYEEGQLEQALEKALRMSADEYGAMVKALEELRRDIADRSLRNLERMLREP